MENQLPKYLQDIVDKLPFEVEITQEMFDEGCKNREDCNRCIGAVMLGTLLPDGYPRENCVSWGTFSGYIGNLIGNVNSNVPLGILHIKSNVNIYMMVRPQTVELSLVQIGII